MKIILGTSARRLLATAGSLVLASGCGEVLGLDDFTDEPATTGQGGESGATTSATTATGTGGGATTGTGGNGGGAATGTGGAGGSFCEPGTTTPCYTGSAGTEDVGMCVGGLQTCNEEGTAYLPECTGEVLPAASDDCEALGDEDCDGYACSEPIWAQSFPVGSAPSVAIDALGNTYVHGTFASSISFGATTLITAGSTDLFLAKLDNTGAPLWAKQFGDSAHQYEGAIAIEAGGNLAVFTPLNGTVNFGGINLTTAGSYDVAVAVFDTNGTHIWSKRFGDSSTQYPKGIAFDLQGNVVILGEFQGAVDFGNGALTSAGSNDIFLAKLSGATGAQVWAKRFGDSAAQNASAIGIDSAGNIAIAGTYSGVLNLGQQNLVSASTDIYLGRFDTAGNHACSQSITSAGGGAVDALTVSSAGNIVLSGSYTGAINLGGASLSSAGQSDVFVTGRSPTCAFQWSQAWGGSQNDSFAALALDSADNIVLSALSIGPIDFGGPTLSSAGLYDVTLAKLTPQGAHLWSRIFGSSGAEGHPAVSAREEILLAFPSAGACDLSTGPLPAGLTVARFAP